MQVLTRADGTIEPIGSVNHAELAKLRSAAKKRKSDDKSDEPKSEPTAETKPDEAKPVAEQKSEGAELKGASVTTADVAPAGPPKPATRGK